MKKENKIIDLFGSQKPVNNHGVKYSKLLEEFMGKFAHELDAFENIEDMFQFAVDAWNFGNFKVLMPEMEVKEIISLNPVEKKYASLLERMIGSKVINYNAHTDFIQDFDVNINGSEVVLKVLIQESDDYLKSMVEQHDEEFSEGNYTDNFIHRKAIVLTPARPFLDWVNQLEEDDEDKIDEIDDSNIYLVSDDIDDVEAWLKKKFDRFFQIELEEWYTDKKVWPQGRTYKMFKQWFEVRISTMVYDMEKIPVFKG